MPIDFSNYSGDLIRAGTIVTVQMRVVFGDATDGALTFTKDRSAEMLKAEFTVLEGEYAKRKSKIFANWIVTGTTDGQKSIAERYNGMLKRIIASAKHLDLSDRSPETLAKYQMNWRDFDGLRFLAEVGVEPGKDGYEDKNVIARVITKDSPAWGGRPPIDQIAPDWQTAPTGSTQAPQASASSATAPAAAPIPKPKWAS
jgi:hypothetical protein